MEHCLDLIFPESAPTLGALFQERVRRTPDATAYRFFDQDSERWRTLSWNALAALVARCQAALLCERLQPGDRVALMLKNCPEWVMLDLAAQGLGLVTVPLYTADRPENVAHVLGDSGARLLLIDSVSHWKPLQEACASLDALSRIVAVRDTETAGDPRLCSLDQWLPAAGALQPPAAASGDLATIIYTSGTTGKSKGVMLSHRNILENCRGILHSFDIYTDDRFFSFLPLSHTFERTAGYYLPMMAGASVTYARSFQQLQEDLIQARPTILMSVPRIYERIHAALRHKLAKGPAYAARLFQLAVSVGYSRFLRQQGRGPWRPGMLLWPLLKRLVADKLAGQLGGAIRIAVSGGAALPPETAKIFIGLGITVLQGYGLTETSPVISVNRPEDNLPESVGTPLDCVETRLSAIGALQVRGPCNMLGYWNNPEATHAILDEDGWLDTGDVVRIDAAGHITITGRVKEIIVLSNGEKVPPVDMESAILSDPLFEQVIVVGEGQTHLAALAVVNRELWQQLMQQQGWTMDWPAGLDHPQARTIAAHRIAQQIQAFPGYAKVRRVALLAEPWTVENGLLTPTLKLKRNAIIAQHRAQYDALFSL